MNEKPIKQWTAIYPGGPHGPETLTNLKSPAVYALFYDYKCVYVGQTSNLGKRLCGHINIKKFNRVLFSAVHRYPERLKQEKRAIKIFKPVLNGTRPKTRPVIHADTNSYIVSKINITIYSDGSYTFQDDYR